MPTYAAFLGHQPRISLAELSAALPDMKTVRMIGNMVAVIETSAELTKKSIDTLGGTMLLAVQLPYGEKHLGKISQTVTELLSDAKGKVTFSLRTDGVSLMAVHGLYRDIKAQLKKSGKPVRYVGSERVPAATVLLHELDMLDLKHGVEIVILQVDDWLWVGRTVAAHNPHAYTKRDMEKPVRDTHVGLLPPKLAQTLLNFGSWLVESRRDPAEKKPKKPLPLTVFDPFCGSGVIPMECLLRGWNVLCSDASQKAVSGCEKNLDWVRKEFAILKRDVTSSVWKQDATKPFELKEKPDVMVSETSLGTPLEKRATQKEISALKSACEKVEAGFIENAAKTLPGVPIVCTFPVWMGSAGPIFLEKVWDAVRDNGFEPVLPPGVSTDVAIHKSLLYRRPDQFVGRQIVLLRPKK